MSISFVSVEMPAFLLFSDHLVLHTMSMADFLKDLPTRNAENFTKINPDSCHRYDRWYQHFVKNQKVPLTFSSIVYTCSRRMATVLLVSKVLLYTAVRALV